MSFTDERSRSQDEESARILREAVTGKTLFPDVCRAIAKSDAGPEGGATSNDSQWPGFPTTSAPLHLNQIPAHAGCAEYLTRQVEDQKAKKDAGKLKWSLLLWEPLADVVRVRMFGDTKYAPGSWKGVSRERYADAAMRHLVSYIQGERLDEESGRPHLAHLICCAMFCMFFDSQPQPKQEANNG